MGHQRAAGALLNLVRQSRRLDPTDPVSQCLAPRLCRSYATETALPKHSPIQRTKTSTNPNVDPSLYSPPKMLTTLHSWPELEPTGFKWYKSDYLDLPLRRDLLHRAVIFEADATRLGTASVRHRTEMPGTNRKIQPQKGLGRARAGDKHSPTRHGGGVAHGPKPRDFSTDLPRKMYDRAWRIALSYRYRKGELMIVEGHIRQGEDQTPYFLENLLAANQLRNSLLVPIHIDKATEAAMQQLAKFAKIRDLRNVDVKDLLGSRKIIIERKALDALFREHKHDLS